MVKTEYIRGGSGEKGCTQARLDVDEKNEREQPKAIVFISMTKLPILFQFCRYCFSTNLHIEMHQRGTSLIITTKCNVMQISCWHPIIRFCNIMCWTRHRYRPPRAYILLPSMKTAYTIHFYFSSGGHTTRSSLTVLLEWMI